MTKKLILFSVAIFMLSTQVSAVNLVAGARGARTALAELQPSSKSALSTEIFATKMGTCPFCVGCNCQLAVSAVNEQMQVQGKDLLQTTMMALERGIPLSAESLKNIQLINSMLARENLPVEAH